MTADEATDNPFEQLERQARRLKHEESAAKAISQARARLVMRGDPASVFFATVALSMQPVPDWSLDTMATDGKRLIYNPEFTDSLSQQEVLAVVVHEALHVANKHHARLGWREPRRANVAMDLAINPIVKEAKFALPACAIFPNKAPFKLPSGLSFEGYYPLLPDDHGSGGNGSGDDPGGCGGVVQPGDGSEAACREAEAAANVLVAQAASAAKQRGQLPASIARLVDEALTPKLDVAEVLRHFVTSRARNDYRWSTPNRRHVWQGLYLPGLESQELGDVVAAFDTSGSIMHEQMVRMGERLQGILECYSCRLTIIFHDADVVHVQTWEPSDGPLRLEPKGGGGTSHVPVFEWIAEQGIDPACLVCLTDLYTAFPPAPPHYPVLWAVLNGPPTPPPFGMRVDLED